MNVFFERLKFYFKKNNPKYKKFRCKKCCLNCNFYNYCKKDFIGMFEDGI